MEEEMTIGYESKEDISWFVDAMRIAELKNAICRCGHTVWVLSQINICKKCGDTQ